MANMFFKGSSFTIRTITEKNKEDILEVYRLCEDFLALGPEPRASLKMVLDDLEISRQEGGCYCGIYGPNGNMLGVVDFVPGGFEGKADTAFLSLLMIAAPFRNQGTGKQVVDLVESEIKKDACITEIRSGVQVNNPAAIRFWQKNGYKIVSGPELLPDTTTAFQLSKKLK